MKKNSEKNIAAYFSNEVLTKLVNDSSSGVKVHRTKKHLTLYPYHLQNVKNSIRSLLNQYVGKYQDDLEGSFLAYKKVTVLTNLPAFIADTCFIHLDVEADFYIFKPKVGDVLPTTIVKTSKDHVGGLIYKTFNVSIPKDEDDINWIGNTLTIGDEVEVKIKKLDLTSTIPYIRGDFFIHSEDSGISVCEEPPINVVNEELEVPEKSKKKSKRKRKIEEVEEASLEETVDEDVKKIKKHKKHKKFKKDNSV